MSELGLCWPLVNPKDRWYERIRKHFQSHRSCISNNCTKISMTQPRQYGGSGLFVTDDLAHKIQSTGRDPTGLGRWSWITIKGHQCNIQIISAYRPCYSQGPETVYAQHTRYFHRTQINPDPRQQILTDLTDALSTWTQQGDLIILCIDANDDTRNATISQFLDSNQPSPLAGHPNRTLHWL